MLAAQGASTKLIVAAPSMFTTLAPNWLQPSSEEEGSIDPLGFQAEAEEIANKLLPGLTVSTIRVRYLSFLCWARRETQNDNREIDRWEVALSCGEHMRHRHDQGACRFLGRQLLLSGKYPPKGRLPARLHVQTARMLYSGLGRSCGFWGSDGSLSTTGEKLADEFARDMPRVRPRSFNLRGRMACLSDLKKRERGLLHEGLFEANEEAHIRLSTFETIGRKTWRNLQEGKADCADVLRRFLDRTHATYHFKASFPLHKAAKLELLALPMARLFYHLYGNQGRLPRMRRKVTRFCAFEIRNESAALVADTHAHLKRWARLNGSRGFPSSTSELVGELLRRHRSAKAEAPWVDEDWKPLRLGLQPRQLPQVHSYRLYSMASLLRDLGEI